MSMKSVSGSGLHAHGPPATTMFFSSVRSRHRSGTPESFSMFKMFV